MVACVVDNSVVMSWVYPAQANAYTERLLDRCASAPVHTAFIWPAEFANATVVLVRRKMLREEQGYAMLALVKSIGLTVGNAPAAADSLFRLCQKHGLSAYDAAYLELALRLGLPLATRDTALVQVARSLDCFLA